MEPIYLSEDQRRIAADAIRERTGSDPLCSYCGSEEVEILDRLYRLEIDGMVGTGQPVFVVRCLNCNHADAFFAFPMGVIDN